MEKPKLDYQQYKEDLDELAEEILWHRNAYEIELYTQLEFLDEIMHVVAKFLSKYNIEHLDLRDFNLELYTRAVINIADDDDKVTDYRTLLLKIVQSFDKSNQLPKTPDDDELWKKVKDANERSKDIKVRPTLKKNVRLKAINFKKTLVEISKLDIQISKVRFIEKVFNAVQDLFSDNDLDFDLIDVSYRNACFTTIINFTNGYYSLDETLTFFTKIVRKHVKTRDLITLNLEQVIKLADITAKLLDSRLYRRTREKLMALRTNLATHSDKIWLAKALGIRGIKAWYGDDFQRLARDAQFKQLGSDKEIVDICVGEICKTIIVRYKESKFSIREFDITGLTKEELLSLQPIIKEKI